MPDAQDLTTLLAGLPDMLAKEERYELEPARRAVPAPRPTIIPMHEFPYRWPHPQSNIMRYPCALGCGWAHDEDAYSDFWEPVVFRLDGQGAIDEPELNERLAARGAALRERIETAIRDHFTAAHPGREIPLR